MKQILVNEMLEGLNIGGENGIAVAPVKNEQDQHDDEPVFTLQDHNGGDSDDCSCATSDSNDDTD